MATVRRVVAPNGGPYTGPGTNTWILGDSPACVVIDPGPDDKAHLDAVERQLSPMAVGAVLVTHGHYDHLAGAESFARRNGVRVLRSPELADGDVVHAGQISVTAIATPGHAADHLAFWMPADRVLFSGDLILGRGSSTFIGYPEGDVAEYLSSLDKVASLAPRIIFPGHWDPIENPLERVAQCRRHRLERENQVMKELGTGGSGTVPELTRRIYAAELKGREELLDAAEMTLRAHLRKLVDEGKVARSEAGIDPEYALGSIQN